jgi:molecular chaperone GrpE
VPIIFRIMQDQPNPNPADGSAGAENATEPTSHRDPAFLEMEKRAQDWEQKYLYLYADFENFKKRSVKERQETLKFGWESVASGLLEVLDNFERALSFAKPEADPALLSGLKMVAQQFKTTLEKQGVAEIRTTDQPFNPELHESVGQIPSEKPQGVIVQEHQKGYTLHGRLLRPSRVLISSGTPAH